MTDDEPSAVLNFIITTDDLDNCDTQIICNPDLIDPSSVVEETITNFTNEQEIEPTTQPKVINKAQYLLELLQDNQLNDFILNHVDKYLDDSITLIKVHTNQRNYFQELLKKSNINDIDDDSNLLSTAKRNRTS